MTEKTTWYKKRKRVDEDAADIKSSNKRLKIKANKQGDAASTVKAVMFVPYTRGSGLAREIREAEEKMESLTGYRLKIVERSGTSLMDILHKSNTWK